MENTIIGPLSDMTKGLEHVNKNLVDINKKEKKQNGLLLAILRFLKSDAGRDLVENEDSSYDFTPILEAFDATVDSNSESLDDTTKFIEQVQKENTVLENKRLKAELEHESKLRKEKSEYDKRERRARSKHDDEERKKQSRHAKDERRKESEHNRLERVRKSEEENKGEARKGTAKAVPIQHKKEQTSGEKGSKSDSSVSVKDIVEDILDNDGDDSDNSKKKKGKQKRRSKVRLPGRGAEVATEAVEDVSKLSKATKALGKIGSKVAKVGGPIGVGLSAFDLVDSISNAVEIQDNPNASEQEKQHAKGEAVGGGIGMAAGAVLGGIVGSLVGPVGTASGAMFGASVGETLGNILGPMVTETDAEIKDIKATVTERKEQKFESDEQQVPPIINNIDLDNSKSKTDIQEQDKQPLVLGGIFGSGFSKYISDTESSLRDVKSTLIDSQKSNLFEFTTDKSYIQEAKSTFSGITKTLSDSVKESVDSVYSKETKESADSSSTIQKETKLVAGKLQSTADYAKTKEEGQIFTKLFVTGVFPALNLFSDENREAIAKLFTDDIIPELKSAFPALDKFTNTLSEYVDAIGESGKGFLKDAETFIDDIFGSSGHSFISNLKYVFRSAQQGYETGGITGAYEGAKETATSQFKELGSGYQQKAPEVMDRYMKELGLTKYQAAGLVGNFGHESAGLRPDINEKNPTVKGSRGGYGWAQWTGPRRKAFEKFAAERGLDIKSDEANFQFSVHEFRTTHKDALEKLKRTNNAEQAMIAVQENYEKAGVTNYQSRMRSTEEALSAYDGKETKTAIAKQSDKALAPLANSLMYDIGQEAIDRGVKYQYGAKNSKGGAIDCSGWVAEVNNQMLKSVGNDPELAKVVNTISRGAAEEGAAGIIRASVETGGGLLKNDQIDESSLTEGTVIGLDHSQGGAKSGDGRYLGIDHVAQVVRDPNTGQMVVSESSSKKGVHFTPVSEWVERNKKQGTAMYASNPYASVGDFQPNKLYKGHVDDDGNIVESVVEQKPQVIKAAYNPTSYSAPRVVPTMNNDGAYQTNVVSSTPLIGQTDIPTLSDGGTYQTSTIYGGNSNVSGTGDYSYNSVGTSNVTTSTPQIYTQRDYGSLTINAANVVLNGNISNASSSSQDTGEKGFYNSNLNSNYGQTSYTNSDYINNPVNSALSSITNIPKAIFGGLFGGVLNNAVNAPTNIMQSMTGQTQAYTSRAMSTPQSLISGVTSSINSALGMPMNAVNSSISNVSSTTSNMVRAPMSAYNALSGAVNTLSNIPNEFGGKNTEVTSKFNVGIPQLPSFNSPSVSSSLTNTNFVGSPSYSNYSESARITEALPAPISVERSQFTPPVYEAPEIVIPEIQQQPQTHTQPQPMYMGGTSSTTGGATYRPSIDEIPINISDTGLMLLNVGYL